jgi:hypothetical protein
MTTLAFAFMAGASVSAQADATADIPVIMHVYGPSGALPADDTTIGQLESQCPVVTPPGINPAQLESDGSAGPETDATANEWTLSTVLSTTGCLPTPIPISAITEVTVVDDGQADLNPGAALSGDDLSPQGDFPDGTVPVFWDTSDNVIYERPNRGPGDDNASDSVTVSPGQSLEFDVFEGVTPVTIPVSATATSIAPGEPVTFTASAPGDPAGESYTWDFDGAAASATGSPTTVTFPKTNSGTYDVTVQASGPVVGYGSIQITVGAAAAGSGTTTTKTGPVKSSGKTPGTGAGQPKEGTAKPKPKPKATVKPKPVTKTSTTTSSGISPTSGGGSSGETGTTYLATPSPTLTTSTIIAPVTTTPSDTSVPVPKPKVAAIRKPVATHKRPTGVRVRGRLIGLVVPLSGSPAAVAKTLTQGSAPALTEPAGSGWDWAALAGALAVLALLALGAGRELRAVRSGS